MVSSFAISVGLLVLAKMGHPLSTHAALMTTVAFTTVCWVLTAYVTPVTDRAVLVAFYTRVKPFGPGWERVRKDAGLPVTVARVASDNVPLALLGWAVGTLAIWASLFTVGNFLYGRFAYAFGLLGVFLVSGLVLLRVVQRLWTDEGPTGEAS